MNKKISTVIVISFLIFTSLIQAQTESPGRQETILMKDYFDLIISGNFESASYLWAPESIQRARKFGIEYDNIVMKNDCTSPIIRKLDVMMSFLQPPIKNIMTLQDHYSQLVYSTVVKGQKVEHDYYAKKLGNYYWLVYPQDYYGRQYQMMQTKYFEIHYPEERKAYLNPIVLDEADKFIDSTCRKLGLTKEDLDLLEEKKITYFFCDNDQTVKYMTGHLVKGTYDMASNDIISAFFPHYHELSHFLVNYKLRKLPLYTLPLFREGMAVYLGGRWGKTNDALNEMASYLYQMKFVEIDSILTMHQFEKNASSEISYPVAGLFCRFIAEKTDFDNLMKMYLDFSGEFDTLIRLSDSEIKEEISKETGYASWSEMLSDFDNFLKDILENQAVIMPGKLKDGKPIVEQKYYTLTEKDNWIGLEYTSNQNDTMMSANILFDKEESLSNYSSLIFEDQYRDTLSYNGYRFGIRFDKFEAGIYDYATSQLLAKYIWSISPSDDYIDKENNKLYFKFDKKILGDILPVEENVKVLAN